MDAQVTIDARAAARPELGGVERWAREMTRRLPEIAPDRYRVAMPPEALSHRAGHLWEQALLPLTARGTILCPANAAPLASRRNVVIVHDVAPLRDPSWYSPLYVRWNRLMVPAVARKARRVITVSEFAASEIEELLGVERGRIGVVAGGVDERFSPEADPVPVRAALGLCEQPYVLTVGSRTTRKNVAILDHAALVLAERGISLVAAGGGRPQFAGDDVPGTVIHVGAVDDALLPGLYAGAAAFVLPSRYEGFGLTALEALASGLPAVLSDIPALREVCGGAAVYVDPDDAGGFADAICGVIDDGGVLRAAAPPRAAPFTWDRAARAVDAEIAALLPQP
ncbi:MAG: glycosyltransferase family 1 protein [Baekduia sp.]